MRRLFSRTRVLATTLATLALASLPASGQELIDRVLARVGGVPVTLSDVRAAAGMGFIDAGDGGLEFATEQYVQRLLLLLEVERFPPPPPQPADVEREDARIRAAIGARMQALVAETGLDDQRIRQAALDSVRIRAYLEQRFGAAGQVSDEEVRAFYTANPGLFRRNGATLPFEQVEPQARQLAAAARRQSTIAQWMTDLRQRADVVRTRP